MATIEASRAAQYVRMSTEKQIYSTDNQMAAIAAYALAHGFTIVRTYADEGRSGLQLKGRTGLQGLLRDVISNEPGYEAVLVFDVSRWGRFQDADEGAHYEFLCRKAGVQVHYCAEMFENDGSLASTIVKNMKRAMAGEYSRELSGKVWAAQSRLVAKGYKMGGTPGYGLRRLLIDRDGNQKQLLRDGEHKSIATDRIVLVPGDPTEIATVKRIFRLASKGLSFASIANVLNEEDIPSPKGGQWAGPTIRAMLRAERYVGANVYNQRSSKLGGPRTGNPRERWVISAFPFEPIIPLRTFQTVQRRYRSTQKNYSDAQLLAHLRGLIDDHGYLASSLIDTVAPPAAKTFFNRFGSLRKAYERIGYDMDARDAAAPPVKAESTFALEIAGVLVGGGREVLLGPLGRLLTVDSKIILAPRIFHLRSDGKRRLWKIKRPEYAVVSFVLAGLMRGDERAKIYLLPIERFGRSGKIEISDGSNHMEDFEVWNLDLLSELITWLSRPPKSLLVGGEAITLPEAL